MSLEAISPSFFTPNGLPGSSGLGNPANTPNNATVSATQATNKPDDPIIKEVSVPLANKPPEQSLGEYLTRQALEPLAKDLGLTPADIDLEIAYVKEHKNGNFIDNLSLGGKKIDKPNELTDAQVQGFVKKGAKTIDFGIHQSTAERMLQRDGLVRWLAQKDEAGAPLSERDKADLAQLGYSEKDLATFRDAKYMYYLGYRSQFREQHNEQVKTLNDDLRNKLVSAELAKLQARPDSDFYVEGKNRQDPDFERRRQANEIVNQELDGKTPFAYLQEKNAGEALEKRLADKSWSDYLSSSSKNLLNSFYGGIGAFLKGIAVTANGLAQYDEDGNKLDRKASDAPIYKAGEWIQQNVQAPNVDRDIEQTLFGGTIPKTVGGLLPAVLGVWVTKSPQAIVAIYSGLSTGGAVYDEAKAKGATESQAQKTALLTGGFIGLTSTVGYGKTLEALNSGPGAATWRAIFRAAVKDGGRNALVAGGQTIGENAIAKGIYDNQRGYLDNVRERMMAAGITGATLKGGLEIIAQVRAGSKAQVLSETQEILRVKPQTETTPKVADLQTQAKATKARLNQQIDNTKLEGQADSVAKTTRLAQQEAVRLLNEAKQKEPTITRDLQTVAKQTNGEIVGLDKRFKTEDSLTRKFADRVQPKVRKAERQGKNADEVRANTLNKLTDKNNDALRYTYTFSPEKYVEGYNATVQAMEKQGYKLVQSDNYWLTKGTKKDTGYRGINATFIAPNGQKFELQFHTPESFKCKNDNHDLYEEGRKPNVSEERKREIRRQNIKLAEPLVMPRDIDKLENVGGEK